VKYVGVEKRVGELKPGSLFCHEVDWPDRPAGSPRQILIKTIQITGSLGQPQYDNIPLNCVGLEDGDFGFFPYHTKVIHLTENG
jgi:hypothetical protein